MTNNNEIKPVTIKSNIHLDMSSRMYLALSRKDISDKLIYVYTFGCKGENGRFYLEGTMDIATFDNPKNATLYTNTISEVMNAQSRWWLYPMFQKTLKKELAMFDRMTK